jgi:hypothetical protein
MVMKDRSIFGDADCGTPASQSAGARTQRAIICNGLFGTKMFPDPVRAPKPGIGPDGLPRSLS